MTSRIARLSVVHWSLLAVIAVQSQLEFAPTVSGAEPVVCAVAVSPDEGSLLIGSQAGVEQRSMADLSRIRLLNSSLEQVHDLTFSTQGDWLAAVGGIPSEEGVVELFAWPSGERTVRAVVAEDLLYAVAWMPGQNQVVVASFDGSVYVVDGNDGNVLRRLEGHSRPVTSVCVLPGKERTGEVIVTGSIDQTLRVWDAATGETLRTLHNHTQAVHALAVRPGTVSGPPMIASVGEDHTVRLWQPTIGRMVRFMRLAGVPLCVRWLPDGSRIVVGCDDGHVRMIDPDFGTVLSDDPVLAGPVVCLDTSPDGTQIVVGGSGGHVRLMPATLMPPHE